MESNRPTRQKDSLQGARGRARPLDRLSPERCRHSRSALLGIFAIVAGSYALTGLSVVAGHVSRTGARALERLLTPEAAFRITHYGTTFEPALDRVRRTLGPSEDYYLVDGGGLAGEPHWVRHELAPRRASLLGRRLAGGRVELTRAVPRRVPYWVVVVEPWPKGPHLVETFRFLQQHPSELARYSDPDLFVTVTAAAASRGSIDVTGACVALRGPDWSGVHAFLDGREHPLTVTARFPRADLPRLSQPPPDLSRAGFAIRIHLDGSVRETVAVSLAFVTPDRLCSFSLPRRVQIPS